MTDALIACLNDCWIDWLIDWLIDYSFDWLIGCSMARLIDWLMEWWNDKWSNGSIDWIVCNISDLDVGEVPWYEEVGLLYPKPYQKRPVVLIGPAQMGRKELLERLVASDPDRFSKPIAHTTRTKKPSELDGRDYHFVSKHVFDGEILKQRFVEYGLFEKQLYGTSIESVNAVIKAGKVCLLVVEPSAIRSLRAANFKPYVVFVAPPSLDKLQQNRLRMGVPADVSWLDGHKHSIMSCGQISNYPSSAPFVSLCRKFRHVESSRKHRTSRTLSGTTLTLWLRTLTKTPHSRSFSRKSIGSNGTPSGFRLNGCVEYSRTSHISTVTWLDLYSGATLLIES